MRDEDDIFTIRLLAEALLDVLDNPALDVYRALMTDVNAVLDASHAIHRDQSKVLFLASMYGMGDKKCGEMLGVSSDVSAMILSAFRTGATWLTALVRAVTQEAKTFGLVETPILKRRARFLPVYEGTGREVTQWTESGPSDSTHTALNRVIQGGAADQVKEALLALDAAGAIMHASVHDEIDVSCDSLDDARKLAQIQADIVPLAVPVVVDVEMGPTWGTLTKDDTLIRSRRYWRREQSPG